MRSPPPCPPVACAPPWRGCARCAPGARAAPATRPRSCGWPAPSTATSPAGGDADLRLLHELAGLCHDPLLRRVVVVVLPDQNPDGRERAYARQLQRLRPQPRLAGAHPARVPGAPARACWRCRRWPTSTSTSRAAPGFFAPPYSAPLFHELPDAALAAERDILRAGGARARSQRKGYPSSSDGTFDLLYPGYGDSATTLLFGAAGMTFEAGRRAPVRAARRPSTSPPPAPSCARSPATARRCCGHGRARSRRRRAQGAHGVLQHRAAPARLRLRARRRRRAARGPADGRGRGRPPAGRRPPGREPAALWLRGARRAGDAGRRHLPGERGAAAQALDRGAAGPEPVGRRAVDVRRQRLVAPAAHGHRRRRARSPPPAAPAAAVPALAAAQPLAGRRLALLGDPAAFASVLPGVEQPNAGTSWARCVLAAPRRAGRRGRRRGPRRRGAGRPRRLRGGRRRAGLAVGPGAAGGLRLRRRAAGPSSAGARGASPWRGRPASRRRRSPPGAPAHSGSPARRSPWAAAWCVDNDDPLLVGGHVVADYGAVLSGWALGLARRAPGDPRRARRRRARASSSPSIPSSAAPSESAEALLTSALTGATPGAR